MIIKKADFTNLISFFSKKQKIVFGIFTLLSFFLVIWEIIAIYLLISLMQMLTKSQMEYSDNIKFLEFLFVDNHLANLILIIFLVYIFKNIYAIGLKNYKFDFNYNLIGELVEKVSSGKKQRIGIARSFYRNPSILVLDRFTSALDIENEQLIFNKVFKKISNLTVLVISHKKTALKNCLRIFHLKDNKIREL